MTQQSHTPEMAASNSATMEWLQQLIEIDGSEIIGHEDIELTAFYLADDASIEVGDE